MTSIRDYLDSIRTSLNILEREADANGTADDAPGMDLGMLLAKLDDLGDSVVNVARYREAVSQRIREQSKAEVR